VAGADGAGVHVAAFVDAPDLHAFSAGGAGGRLAALPAHERHELLARIGRTLRAMHDAEVTHRDLKAPNLLVTPETPDGISFADLEGVRIRHRPVPWARRARDLARLDASLGAQGSDPLRVLRAYMAVLPRPPVSLREIARRIARHVRIKRGPGGAPR
jgi:tRNA A-37 threonylcarbamoyl transferase component Bud32